MPISSKTRSERPRVKNNTSRTFASLSPIGFLFQGDPERSGTEVVDPEREPPQKLSVAGSTVRVIRHTCFLSSVSSEPVRVGLHRGPFHPALSGVKPACASRRSLSSGRAIFPDEARL